VELRFTARYFSSGKRFAIVRTCFMMTQILMDTETMVGVTVFASLVITAAVLIVRSKLTKVPVRQTVRVDSRGQ